MTDTNDLPELRIGDKLTLTVTVTEVDHPVLYKLSTSDGAFLCWAEIGELRSGGAQLIARGARPIKQGDRMRYKEYGGTMTARFVCVDRDPVYGDHVVIEPEPGDYTSLALTTCAAFLPAHEDGTPIDWEASK